MKLIEVKCYNCDSKNYSLYDVENGYNLVKCDDCGLLYVNPRPDAEEISKAKLTGLHEGEDVIQTTGRYMKSKVRKYMHVLDDLFHKEELSAKQISWLDIGCGFGELMQALQQYSKGKIKVLGSELNETKIAEAKKRKLDVGMYDLDTIEEKFDALSLLNVYSHLPDPVGFLKDIAKLLKPGGELLIETGHTAHLPKESQYRPYYLPDHLSFANQDIVENILEKAGFEVVKTKLYRSPIYPRWYNVRETVIEVLKIILRRHGSLKNFFPKDPNTDMFIRCRLKN